MKTKNEEKSQVKNPTGKGGKETGSYLSLPKPKPKPGGAAESEEPLVWNPRYVVDLVARAGENAAVLCLGRREAEALKTFLGATFPEEEIVLHGYRYAGLRVVVVGDESCLRVETVETLFESSRHALLRKHEERPRGEVRKSLEQSAFRFRMT